DVRERSGAKRSQGRGRVQSGQSFRPDRDGTLGTSCSHALSARCYAPRVRVRGPIAAPVLAFPAVFALACGSDPDPVREASAAAPAVILERFAPRAPAPRLDGPKLFLEGTAFTAGESGFARFRAPSLAIARSGAILAFAQAQASLLDQAQNKLVMKRSDDL